MYAPPNARYQGGLVSSAYGPEPLRDWSWEALGRRCSCQGKGDAYLKSRETGCPAKKGKEKESSQAGPSSQVDPTAGG